MLKKLMILAAVLMIPFALASAASAAPAQYPPSAGGGNGGVSGGSTSTSSGSGTTLARTGSDNSQMVMVGLALVGVGGIAVVTSKRLRSTT